MFWDYFKISPYFEEIVHIEWTTGRLSKLDNLNYGIYWKFQILNKSSPKPLFHMNDWNIQNTKRVNNGTNIKVFENQTKYSNVLSKKKASLIINLSSTYTEPNIHVKYKRQKQTKKCVDLFLLIGMSYWPIRGKTSPNPKNWPRYVYKYVPSHVNGSSIG